MIDVVAGYLFDLIVGDPNWYFHPVRFIGKLIEFTERFFRRVFIGTQKEKIGGIILVIIVVSSTYISTYGALWLAGFNSYFYHAVNILLVYFILAARSLHTEASKVFKALEYDNIYDARKMLSRIVGRDTTNLDNEEIIRATVETVAENTSDGVIAPLFYIFLGGAPLGMAYKAINTLDSMVGYKNTRYINFGWASARLDDLVNYLPARITGVLLVAASAIYLKSPLRAWRIMIRDGRNHSSPNSGYPEAAVAGSLGIQLGGTNYYFGEKMDKPTIGDPVKNKAAEDIKVTIRLMYIASSLFIGIYVIWTIIRGYYLI